MRLIDADALSELVGEPIEVFLGRLDLKLPPTIDAEPVRHAKLLNAHPYGECSNCGYLIDIREEFNYCPNCGADMRGEK